MKIKYHVLDNGLRLILGINKNIPVVSCWIFYRVGSRNERPGITGISHYVEHMLFKGGEKYGKGDIDRFISERGGVFNGMTSEDFTLYFETLPSNFLELALDIEYDRMLNAKFDPIEVDSERTVILSEREGAENYPQYLLEELVQGTAFLAHPYKWPVIGWKSDILSITREDLIQYYKSFYAPINSTLVLTGNIDEKDAIKIIEKKFGEIDKKGMKTTVNTKEPKQSGERRVYLKKPGTTRYMYIAYHVPEASSEDSFPLIVLDGLLGGAKSFNPFRAASFVKSSRLYNVLVNRGLAKDVSTSYSLKIDPYLFWIKITLSEKASIDRVEKTLFKEINKIIDGDIKDSELKRVKDQIRSQMSYGSEGATGFAFMLGYLETVSSYKYLEKFEEELKKIDIKDIRRVAEKCLVEDNRTIGIFIPKGD